mgnify:FL=1
MESCRQDRTVDIISFVYMIFVAACIYISGHENIIGSLCTVAVFVISVIGLLILFVLYRNIKTNFCFLFSTRLTIIHLVLLSIGMDYRWISYILILYIVVTLNMICR